MSTTCELPAADVCVVVGGNVEHGDERGRLLGFPTANLGLEQSFVDIRDGVYVGDAHLPDGRVVRTAVSVGRRPTFYEGSGRRLLEAHLLDFEGDLYDIEIRVELWGWIRDLVKFDGIEQLTEQLRRDVTECRAAHRLRRAA